MHKSLLKKTHFSTTNNTAKTFFFIGYYCSTLQAANMKLKKDAQTIFVISYFAIKTLQKIYVKSYFAIKTLQSIHKIALLFYLYLKKKAIHRQ
jgi:hypothetical protein